MNYIIREMSESEYAVLDDFLYEAIFIPEGVSSPSREIIYQPELQVYVDGFGTKDGDYAFVADLNGKIVGAVWTRITNDYGHIDNDTPSFAISLYKEYSEKRSVILILKRPSADQAGGRLLLFSKCRREPFVRLKFLIQINEIAVQNDSSCMI